MSGASHFQSLVGINPSKKIIWMLSMDQVYIHDTVTPPPTKHVSLKHISLCEICKIRIPPILLLFHDVDAAHDVYATKYLFYNFSYYNLKPKSCTKS